MLIVIAILKVIVIVMLILIVIELLKNSIPVDVISTLDLPRGKIKKGCAACKKLGCQYLDSSLKSVNILVQINLTA